jgi:uncharacterized protein
MDQPTTSIPTLIVPAGTHVVSRVAVADQHGENVGRGAVGVITETPDQADGMYRVRLPDDRAVDLRRSEFSIRRSEARALPLENAIANIDDYRQYIIYACVVGSRAYGLDHEASDVDRRGVYLPPADLHWSLAGAPEQLERPETEECYWELQKFLVLALKANPNILECLYSPIVERITPIGHELLVIRSIFLSQLIYQTYNGYVLSQFRKLEGDLRTTGTLKWKHAMHLIRLLLSGITILREGFVPLRIEAHREQLLAIRRGDVPWNDVNAWRLDLHRQFDAALQTTNLPSKPDYAHANAFLIAARRRMAEGGIDAV